MLARIGYNTRDQDNLGTSCLRAPTKNILKTNLREEENFETYENTTHAQSRLCR
jgi:hypothetical protein